MTMPLTTPLDTTETKLNRTDLMIAVIALLFLLVARPILAQTPTLNPAAGTATNTAIPSNTTGVIPPGGSINPQSSSSTVSPSSTTIPTYVSPAQTTTPVDSQAHREASARQNGGTSLNPQAMPECRIDDNNCIQQRNQLNQTNPQTAPTFNR